MESGRKVKVMEKVNFKTILFILSIILVGALFIWLGSQTNFIIYSWLKLILQNFGAVLIATGLLTFFWDLRIKRAFLDEILEKVGVAKEIELAGITNIHRMFYGKVNWEDLFQNVCKLDLFFSYARTWRRSNIGNIEQVAKSKDSRIRVVLPDYNKKNILKELEYRFDCKEEELIGLIKETEDFFKELKVKNKNSEIDIWLLSTVPYFSYYRFDSKAVITLYSYRKEAGPVDVPVIMCKSRGTFFDYFYEEFKAMVSSSKLSKKIT